jgi:hypothetical protein
MGSPYGALASANNITNAFLQTEKLPRRGYPFVDKSKRNIFLLRRSYPYHHTSYLPKYRQRPKINQHTRRAKEIHPHGIFIVSIFG